MSRIRPAAWLLACGLALAACDDQTVQAPPPASMTAEAVGRYCQMYILEHPGPKAQVHLASDQDPIWFSQVRDAIAFLRRPEEPRDVVAVYVSDMGRAPSWQEPGPDNWVDGKAATYVIDSRVVGGMGIPEAVPFGDRAEAETFVQARGGRVVALEEIPDIYVLGRPDAGTME